MICLRINALKWQCLKVVMEKHNCAVFPRQASLSKFLLIWFSTDAIAPKQYRRLLFEWHFQMFQVLVRSVLEFRELFAKGCLRRKAGHTGLNDVSSRSHGVLFVSIENVESGTVIGKLNLIDLAGIRTSAEIKYVKLQQKFMRLSVSVPFDVQFLKSTNRKFN